MLIVFDIDDTLGCTKHRRHHIIPPGHEYAAYNAQTPAGDFAPDWDSFFAARYDDEPIRPALEMFFSFVATGQTVQLWTAARESSRELTERWLRDKCTISSGHLTLMRPEGDFTKTVLLKEKWVLEHKPAVLFDDHVGIVEMARKHGVYACAVGNQRY